MFGNVTSSWANPQQNQQQQTSAFGQPSAFGATNTTGAFGSTGAFGQPQQQQQPAANPMFGNLSTPATNTGTSGFGAFGQTANNNTSAFGAKPATTGFGAFGGGTSTFGGTGTSTGAFGQPAATTTTGTGLFGQPAATGTTSTFGGTGIFGANANKPSVFGTSSLGTTNPPVVTTGTSNPPYAAHTNKEEGGTFHYQSISCIPAYQGYSFEELRVQDYTQGRKTASAAPSAFGATPSTFGGAQPAATGTGLFGSTPAQQGTTSAFGQTPAAPTTGFGAFGATANQPATTQPTGGLFSGGSAFGGATTQPNQTSAFGGFGQNQQNQQQSQQQGTGLFGGSSAFGNTANKPATGFGGFGTTAPATGGFGTGAFGATNTQQQPPQTGGLFGNTQNQGATGGFGAFGGTANKSIFGGTNTTTQPATTGFGAFGTNTQQQQQPAGQTGGGLFGGGGGLFGNSQNQQQQQQPAAPTGGLFGNNTNTQTNQTGTTGGLFGGGGLFGNNQNQQNQQQPAGGLFGAKPATTTGGGLFGGFGQQQNTANNQQTGGGLFGNALGQQQNQQQTAFGGLFGNKPATAPLGQTMSTGGTGLFGSAFGASTNTLANSTAPAQPSLTASIAQPIGSNLPIFSMLPPGPRLVDLDQSQQKKKAPFFVDVPTRTPIPRVSTNKKSTFTPATSKLRGFGSSVAGQSNNGNPFASSTSVAFMNGKPGALAISDGRASSVGPDGFLGRSGSPALGSGSRQSVKKVILDKKVEPSQLFVKSGSPGISGSKIVFSPALSVAARESEATASANEPATPTPAPRNQQRSPNRFGAQNAKNVDGASGATSDATALEEGDYYVQPDLAALKKLGYDELSSFKGLIVGRVGYGEIEFLEPVDLTGLPKLSALLGDVIHFDPKECSVYPDSEDSEKPPPGSGLNVRAKLSLDGCWAVDKATREPLKDSKHPVVVKHLKRLKTMKDTKFENFDMETGKWTFTVEHF